MFYWASRDARMNMIPEQRMRLSGSNGPQLLRLAGFAEQSTPNLKQSIQRYRP